MICKVLYKGFFIDVSEDLLSKTFEYQKRIDEAFATGRVQIKTNKITGNIPPYSIMVVTDNSIDSYYLCSSTATKYLTNDKWVHDVELLEPTAILECFILGSKSFSSTGGNPYDYNKIDIISKLMKQKYNVTIDWINGTSFFDAKHDFIFGPGTTWFTAVTEIGTKYNYRPKVREISYGRDGSTAISAEFINISGESEYPLDGDRILNIRYSQNTDNYCRLLEGEMTNVIDRNCAVRIKNITPRSDTNCLNDDEAKIILPTRIESISDFRVRKKGEFDAYIRFTKTEMLSIIQRIEEKGLSWGTDVNHGHYISKTLAEWSELGVLFACERINGAISVSSDLPSTLWDNYLKDYLPESYYTSQVWTLTLAGYNASTGEYIDLLTGFSPGGVEDIFVYSGQITFDLSHRILERKQWELLPLEDQPKYAVYDTGGASIYNLNASYRDDLWNKVLGSNIGNVIEEAKSKIFLFEDKYENMQYMRIEYNISGNASNPSEYSYSVEYIPIVNPLIINSKNDNPSNETKYKNLARSYEKGSNFIDYDLLVDSMGKTNSMLGRSELYIEYDIDGIEAPEPGQKIIHGEDSTEEYYIISAVFRQTFARNYVELNLCKSYSKIADAIGVKTQFESTKNPLTNIIERPIHINYEDKEGGTRILSPDVLKYLYFRIEFSSRQTLFKKAVFLTYNNIVHAYCEAVDQYVFDRKDTGSAGNRECKIIPYCDSNNECDEAYISIVYISSMSDDQSRCMPEYTGEYSVLMDCGKVELYKDAREKLTFTVKANVVEFI